jgi:hypothetical protein
VAETDGQPPCRTPSLSGHLRALQISNLPRSNSSADMSRRMHSTTRSGRSYGRRKLNRAPVRALCRDMTSDNLVACYRLEDMEVGRSRKSASTEIASGGGWTKDQGR